MKLLYHLAIRVLNLPVPTNSILSDWLELDFWFFVPEFELGLAGAPRLGPGLELDL